MYSRNTVDAIARFASIHHTHNQLHYSFSVSAIKNTFDVH